MPPTKRISRNQKKAAPSQSAPPWPRVFPLLPSPRSTMTLPSWPPTWDMARSTIVMPCNYSGYTTDPVVSKFGLIDYDWSNARAAWTNQQPMDCQERLLRQAQMTKAGAPASNKDMRVFVYRNLVKALPWYTQVREKMLDPDYSGWFLKYKEGGASGLPAGSYYTPPCTVEDGEKKCSSFYHDHLQTPSAAEVPSRTQVGKWFVYNNTNDVCGLRPGVNGIIDGGQQVSWEACMNAADTAGRKVFVWWNSTAATATENATTLGNCWLTSGWITKAEGGCGGGTLPISQTFHVSGYKRNASAAGGDPPPAGIIAQPDQCFSGKCDCGEGLPCGEYLFDHRNQSLREWLIQDFVLDNKTGLGNPAIDGFYFDDSWHTAPAVAPTKWVACSASPLGGASEEHRNCSYDMGLSAQDVADITGNWSETAKQVEEAVLSHGGFTWGASSLFVGTGARVAQKDSSGLGGDPKATCVGDLRTACGQKGQSRWYTGAFIFEFTRKTFRDPFPLPYVTQDVAQFLLMRGKYAWLGHNWMGCDEFPEADQLRPAAVDVDYGEPIDEFCRETAQGSGVFVRNWTKVSVSVDCNSWTGTLDMKQE